MQNRVYQFHATEPLQRDALVKVPSCKETFCRWLLVEAGNAASGQVARPMGRLRGRAPPAMPAAAATMAGQSADVKRGGFAYVASAPTLAPTATSERLWVARTQSAVPAQTAGPETWPFPDPGDEERELMEAAEQHAAMFT